MAAAREEEGKEARVGGGRSRGGFMEGKGGGAGGGRWSRHVRPSRVRKKKTRGDGLD